MELDSSSTIVQMYNPDIDGAGTCTVAGFNSVWKHRGWELVGASAAIAGETLGRTVRHLDDLTDDDLRMVLDIRGVYAAGTKRADMVAALDGLSGGGSYAIVEEPDTTDPDAAPFDPSSQTVEKVNAELERVAGNPLEVDRILAAEKAGKKRAGIVERGNS